MIVLRHHTIQLVSHSSIYSIAQNSVSCYICCGRINMMVYSVIKLYFMAEQQ